MLVSICRWGSLRYSYRTTRIALLLKKFLREFHETFYSSFSNIPEKCDFFHKRSRFYIIILSLQWMTSSLRKKCPYSELFWSVFSRIRTRITPNIDTFHVVHYRPFLVKFPSISEDSQETIFLESVFLDVENFGLQGWDFT